MSIKLSEACVYTIATPERIRAAAKSGEPLHELKKWATAARLLKEAHSNKSNLPIVFADSRHCSRLIAWSTLKSVSVTTKGTHYQIGYLWALPSHKPQDLLLLTNGEHIAANYIRPYVLCRTPSFLDRQALKPRAWPVSKSERRTVLEGRRRLVSHERIERDRGLIAKAKRLYAEGNEGRLPCEICGFDFLTTYGDRGSGFIEAHHKKSLASSPRQGRKTSLNDLALVCANCHRMLHVGPDFPKIESLRERVGRARGRKR